MRLLILCSPAGEFLHEIKPKTSSLQIPHALLLDECNSLLLVADRLNSKVRAFQLDYRPDTPFSHEVDKLALNTEGYGKPYALTPGSRNHSSIALAVWGVCSLDVGSSWQVACYPRIVAGAQRLLDLQVSLPQPMHASIEAKVASHGHFLLQYHDCHKFIVSVSILISTLLKSDVRLSCERPGGCQAPTTARYASYYRTAAKALGHDTSAIFVRVFAHSVEIHVRVFTSYAPVKAKVTASWELTRSRQEDAPHDIALIPGPSNTDRVEERVIQVFVAETNAEGNGGLLRCLPNLARCG
eukprot:scaffold63252_cov46-Prasinocladus_malaysianus.AAC.2